jgi:hypothetical protein
MPKEIIYTTDLEKNKEHGFEASIFLTEHNTIRIFIADPDEELHSGWIDFDKESLNELIKDLKKLSKELQ